MATDLAQIIAGNLAEIRAHIAAAAARGGRSPADVTLVAVTKYAGVEAARALFEAGCADLAESRPQELWSKAAALAELPVRWHLVGRLQRNKVRRTLPLVHLVHSVDSTRLLAELESEATAAGCEARVLLEVNLSGEEKKQGLGELELPAVVASLHVYPHVRVLGLMGMAGLSGGAAEARREFDRLSALRDRLAGHAPPSVELRELSMGMSGDFEQAIEAGATIVRIGSALFAGI